MKQFRLSFLFTMLMSMMSSNTFAYDIAVENKDGVTIYYTLVYDDKDDVVLELSFFDRDYEGELFIPEEVTYKGQTLKVTSIGIGAFGRCVGLTSVTIPNSVTSIKRSAFAYCTGLTSVTNSNGLISIGEEAFFKCTGLKSITIPNGVRSIEHWAFGVCTSLTSITIPKSVLSIDHSFDYCSGITSISVEEGNMIYDSRGNCNALIKTESNTLLFGCVNTIIPNSVTSIGSSAFERCVGLTSVTIPNNIITIDEEAFAYCDKLTSVIIPNSVTHIGHYAFSVCTSLMDVYCYSEKVSTGDDGQGLFTYYSAFMDSNPENITLHVPEGCIDAYKAIAPWKWFKEIVAIDNTGIRPVSSYNTVKEVYSIGGERKLSPNKGVNIIKMNDGTTKKVLVK